MARRKKRLAERIALPPLFMLQEALDLHINEEHAPTPGEDRIAKLLLAFTVELGEIANELPTIFKFWSFKQDNRPAALEEYVDGLHFLLSLGLALGFSKTAAVWPVGETWSRRKAFEEVYFFAAVATLDYTGKHSERVTASGGYENLFSAYLGLGDVLGFTWQEVRAAYDAKNKINHARQNVAY